MKDRLLAYGIWLGWPALIIPTFWWGTIPASVCNSLMLVAMIYPLPAMWITVRRFQPPVNPRAPNPDAPPQGK